MDWPFIMTVIKNLNKVDILIRAKDPSELSYKIHQFQLQNDMMTGDSPFMQAKDGTWYKTIKVNLEELINLEMLEDNLADFFGGLDV